MYKVKFMFTHIPFLQFRFKQCKIRLRGSQLQQVTVAWLFELHGCVIYQNDHTKNLGFKGKHTFANKWESNPYNVIKKPCQDISVYIVRDDQGREITLHRNHPQPQKKSTAVQPRASKSHLHQKNLYTHRRMRKSLKKLKYKHKV